MLAPGRDKNQQAGQDLPESRKIRPQIVHVHSTRKKQVSMWSVQGEYSTRGTHKQLHFRHFLIHFFHEGDDKLDKLVLKKMLGVIVRNQKADIVSLRVTGVSKDQATKELDHDCRNEPLQASFGG
jgi:hypothetical protein